LAFSQARPGGGVAGPGLLQQRHRDARLGQPRRHAHAEHPGADHRTPARPAHQVPPLARTGRVSAGPAGTQDTP
jgi:hypothetical protein